MEDTKRQDNSQNLIDIFEIGARVWKAFRRMWIPLVLICCIGLVGNVVRTRLTYHKQYEASASFIVSAGGSGGAGEFYSSITAQQLSTTFPYILTSGILNRIVANDLEMAAVPGAISASVLEETNLFQIRVTAAEPKLAYEILQSVIENYPSVAKYVVGDTTLKLIDETGVPTEPKYKPNYVAAAMKGIILGLGIDVLLLMLVLFLHNTVKNQEDLKKFLNVKYLGGVPQERAKRRSNRENESILIDRTQVSYFFREALNTLQVRVNREMKAKEMKTLVVTSTLAGEGKTTVACNLASTMSAKGYKVLLVDADFRNPSVAKVLQLPKKNKGIADVLRGTARPEEAICQVGEKNLWVLPGVKPQEKVAGLYRNGRFRELIESYRETMDIILIDTPPCGIMNDAALAADCAEGVMLVIRQDFARREKILEGVELFAGSHTPIVGCVINGEEMTGSGYGKYGYGKYGYGKYGYGKYGKYGYGKYGYGEDEKKEE